MEDEPRSPSCTKISRRRLGTTTDAGVWKAGQEARGVNQKEWSYES
jgi:hypothetical protein